MGRGDDPDLNLGKVYFRKRDYYMAALEFDYACDLMPRQAEPRNNLGLAWAKAGEFDRAVDLHREAVALDRESIEFRANLAHALVLRGDRTDEVRSLLRDILDRDSLPQRRVWGPVGLPAWPPRPAKTDARPHAQAGQTRSAPSTRRTGRRISFTPEQGRTRAVRSADRRRP